MSLPILEGGAGDPRPSSGAGEGWIGGMTSSKSIFYQRGFR
jgi:hypothetical protein